MKTIDELIEKAREVLVAKGVKLEILEGGTERGLTIKRNREVLDSIGIKMSLLSDVEPSVESEFLGRSIKMPVMPAPLSGLIKSVDPDCFRRIIDESWRGGVIPWIGYPVQDNILEFEKEFVSNLLRTEKEFTMKLRKLRTQKQLLLDRH